MKSISKIERQEEPLKVAYIMSRFPKLTETFILYEMLSVEEVGAQVEIFPLLREKQKVVHAEARRMVARARFHPFLSRKILAANLYFLLKTPGSYLKVWWEILSAAAGSANFFFGSLGILPKSFRMAYEMRTIGINHVHAHFATHPAVAALIINRVTGIPFSFTAHGSDLHVDRRMLPQKLKAAAFAVAVSDYNRNIMVQEGGADSANKIVTLHCGVDAATFDRKSEKAPSDRLAILCVGSFEEVKGHTYLIQACRLLKERGVLFFLHLAGEGPLRAEIERLVRRLELDDDVAFHGGLPRHEILHLLHRADVAALASIPTAQGKREGIPVVLMEAMASSLPIVSSRLSGIPELVEHGISGLLAEPGDVSVLANHLETLSQQPEMRRQMGAKGREKILSAFDLKQNARNLVSRFRTSRLLQHNQQSYP